MTTELFRCFLVFFNRYKGHWWGQIDRNELVGPKNMTFQLFFFFFFFFFFFQFYERVHCSHGPFLSESMFTVSLVSLKRSFDNILPLPPLHAHSQLFLASAFQRFAVVWVNSSHQTLRRLCLACSSDQALRRTSLVIKSNSTSSQIA